MVDGPKMPLDVVNFIICHPLPLLCVLLDLEPSWCYALDVALMSSNFTLQTFSILEI